MYCIKCGKEIPEGELFCIECSLAPLEDNVRIYTGAHGDAGRTRPASANQTVSAPQKATKTAVQSPKKQQAAKAAPRQQQKKQAAPDKSKVKQPKQKKARPWGLITCLLLCLAVAVGACAYIVLTYQSLNQQKATLRVREADLLLRESELEDLQTAYDDAISDLESMTAERDALETEVASLEAQINGSESERSQSQYDISTREKEIERLTEENTTLSDELSALEEDNVLKDERISQLTSENEELESALSDMTNERDELQSDYDALRLLSDGYQVKANFLDDYIVFVMNDGTNYYHTFDCASFTRRDFWAYNRSLAISNGYTACPDCGGGG